MLSSCGVLSDDLYEGSVLLSALDSLHQEPWEPRAHIILGSAFQHRRWTQGPRVMPPSQALANEPNWLFSYVEWASKNRNKCPHIMLRNWLSLVVKTQAPKIDCYLDIIKETLVLEGPQKTLSTLLDTHGCSLADAQRCIQLAPRVRSLPSVLKNGPHSVGETLESRIEFVAQTLFGKLRPLTPIHGQWLSEQHLETRGLPKEWWRYICYVHVPQLTLPHALVTLDGRLLIYSGCADPDYLQCAHELGHLWEELLRYSQGPQALAHYLLLPSGTLERTALCWELRMAQILGCTDAFWYWNFDVNAQLLRHEINLVQDIIGALTAGRTREQKSHWARLVSQPGFTRSPLASAAYCSAALALRP